ncbi:type IV toxin-antitoxin system AbiEi family antitoxin [Actinoplanes sp. N902-109]|uniref:type IV toxin-antitoxin system AbiEi family antitoxin n=1 Tax=Actinoplanes sp. (strain N902-109) TaxID=649831 RepID=UPI000329358D|nr:type IV toxin-antitoxin system AbiEi family antitoxin [Actinoplanes sp. N902-109]AGL14205.1 hypothetical protein L083_0695 [Actinoplanes sp. N902-109]
MHSVLSAALQRLQEFGIESKVDAALPGQADNGLDAVVTFSRVGETARYGVVVLTGSITFNSVVRRSLPVSADPLLIIGDQISRRSALLLRDAGFQFVDGLGNAFVKFGSVLIEVQGRTMQEADRSSREASIRQVEQPANLFSSRRSQVVLALLSWPGLLVASVRDIARVAGVSVGQAHDSMARLTEAGFLSPSSRRMIRADDLLDYWTAAYPNGLGKRLALAGYHGDTERPVQLSGTDGPIFLSGESAKGTDVMRPATLTLYVDALNPLLAMRNKWNSRPDRTPNVFLRRTFWTEPGAVENDPPEQLRNAPWPLVYADLMAIGDARLREVAKTWRDRCASAVEV